MVYDIATDRLTKGADGTLTNNNVDYSAKTYMEAHTVGCYMALVFVLVLVLVIRAHACNTHTHTHTYACALSPPPLHARRQRMNSP